MKKLKKPQVLHGNYISILIIKIISVVFSCYVFGLEPSPELAGMFLLWGATAVPMFFCVHPW